MKTAQHGQGLGRLAGAAAFASCLVAGVSTSQAALVHRYGFNDGTGKDSVGAANGSLATGSAATIAGGTLNTTFGGNTINDALLLPATVGTGITGDFTIEDFVTLPTDPTQYATLFSIGNSQNNFLLVNANRPNTTGLTVNFDPGPASTNEQSFSGASPLPAGSEIDLAIVYTSATSSFVAYVNGTSMVTGTLGSPFNFATTANGTFDGINGESPFTGDNTPNASTDDFRVYNNALTAAQVSADFTAGPNAVIAVPEPTTAGVIGLVAASGLIRRRRHA